MQKVVLIVQLNFLRERNISIFLPAKAAIKQHGNLFQVAPMTAYGESTCSLFVRVFLLLLVLKIKDSLKNDVLKNFYEDS